MSTQTSSITDTAWVLLGTGLTVCVLQVNGPARVFIGASAPSGGSNLGFYIKSGPAQELPSVATLGGGVWVKSVLAVGSVIYAVA